jgi:hypothetical protein
MSASLRTKVHQENRDPDGKIVKTKPWFQSTMQTNKQILNQAAAKRR